MLGAVLEAGDKKMSKTHCLPLRCKQLNKGYKQVNSQLQPSED